MSEESEVTAIADLMASSGVGFGTSGARGLADAMTDRVCYLYTSGFLQYLESSGRDTSAAMRWHWPGIFAPAARASWRPRPPQSRGLGYRPLNCGKSPVRQLAGYAIGEGIASLMVTGSHIPDDRNGIKFKLPEGEVLKADEAGIREQDVRAPRGLFDDSGALYQPP